jgi:hypothetical protein
MQFERLLPHGRFFLDVDMLDFSITRLEEYVSESAAMVVLLTGSRPKEGEPLSDYFTSHNCRRELRAALNARVPIVLVLEHDEVPLQSQPALPAPRLRT